MLACSLWSVMASYSRVRNKQPAAVAGSTAELGTPALPADPAPPHPLASAPSAGAQGRCSVPTSLPHQPIRPLCCPPHAPATTLQQGLKGGALFRAAFRTNPSDRSQGYCSLPGLPTDVFVRVGGWVGGWQVGDDCESWLAVWLLAPASTCGAAPFYLAPPTPEAAAEQGSGGLCHLPPPVPCPPIHPSTCFKMQGLKQQNRAVEGDQVAIRILPPTEWYQLSSAKAAAQGAAAARGAQAGAPAGAGTAAAAAAAGQGMPPPPTLAAAPAVRGNVVPLPLHRQVGARAAASAPPPTPLTAAVGAGPGTMTPPAWAGGRQQRPMGDLVASPALLPSGKAVQLLLCVRVCLCVRGAAAAAYE